MAERSVGRELRPLYVMLVALVALLIAVCLEVAREENAADDSCHKQTGGTAIWDNAYKVWLCVPGETDRG